uniref:C-type lectin domain-containing protein n=1 Tax=Seriola lalandi dorsalis TaxID=1841481 RepID=A0A3B4Y119_SERLL
MKHVDFVCQCVLVSADLASLPNYTIHHTKVNFDQAKENCSPNVLTTLATEQEATEILRLISRSVLPESEFIFWVGLRKAKNECVVPALPLRGFKWAKDGSEESQVSRWMKEPQSTCTTVRCAALQVLFNQSAVTWWGLIPVTCKNSYQFICKLTRRTAEDRRTTTTLAAPEPPKHVECWSYIPLELHCWGHPAVWHFVDDSPANFTTICLPCSDGFHKDASANCVDIDECTSGARCRHTCLNTEGSYRCICSDENGKHHDEGSPACTDTMATDDNSTLTGILIAVAITVVVLVVLVVVILVAVKYCLMRRSEKRAMKDLERMAMKNKDGLDSFTTSNEKTAT